MNLCRPLQRSPSISRLPPPSFSPSISPSPSLLPLLLTRNVNTTTTPTGSGSSSSSSSSSSSFDLDNDIPLVSAYTLEPTDPWAFLQGVKKTVAYEVPRSRQLPQTAAPFDRTTNPFSAPRPIRSPPSSTTLCERERLIFAQIFEQILSNKKISAKRTPSGVPFPSPSLNALFESAVGPQQSGNEISFGPRDGSDRNSTIARLALASSFEQFSPAVRVAAAKAAGVVGSLWTTREMEEIKEQLGDRIQEMNKCETDLELGAWMEKHVFSMVSSDPSSKSFPPGIYAFLLAEGMRILRITFNDLQGVFSIFGRIKALGAESYVVGCSVDVYNQMIAAKWEGTRDLYKVKELVDEMETNGIQGNKKTLRTIEEIMQDVAAVDRSYRWTHRLFNEGNCEVVSGLKERVGVWEKPRKEPGIIGDGLESLSV